MRKSTKIEGKPCDNTNKRRFIFFKGWRGGESQPLLIARALRDLGDDVELMVRARSELARRSIDDGFKLHYARMKKGWDWFNRKRQIITRAKKNDAERSKDAK